MVDYDSKNIILKNYSKEEILKKRLYPYIPYYILRYEDGIKTGEISVDFIEEELTDLLKGLEDAMVSGYIDAFAFNNIKAFTNTIIEHFITGNNRERLVKVMGGQIITTEADLILEQGKIIQYIETCRDFEADDEFIMNGLMNKFKLSKEDALKMAAKA